MIGCVTFECALFYIILYISGSSASGVLPGRLVQGASIRVSMIDITPPSW